MALVSGGPHPPGESKKRGVREPDRDLELAIGAWPFVDGFRRMAEGDVAVDLARCAPPSVGGGLKTPRGGPPPPPHH